MCREVRKYESIHMKKIETEKVSSDSQIHIDTT